MDIIQSAPVCVLNTISLIPQVNLNDGLQNDSVQQSGPEQHLYFISMDQINGTPQLLQLTEEQPKLYGINVYNDSRNDTPKAVESAKKKKPKVKHIDTNTGLINNNPIQKVQPFPKPLGSCENPIEIIKDGEILHSTQNISPDYLQEIAKALHTESFENVAKQSVNGIEENENVVYRVVYPEELDLRPFQTKRGRPKKRLHDVKRKPESKVDEAPKPIQSVRTRSGRITRPPRYIKKEFRQIETSEIDNNEGDLKVMEFEPLKTNQSTMPETIPTETKLPPNLKRKRYIASQYRCPKCQKAYLGHNRMLQHIQKHPDHGPLLERSKSEENDTWNYLIDIANTNPIGQKGMKFCNQLLTLFQNIQIVAKLLFKKSSGTDKNLYFINSVLSKILGIESGNYVINENELQKNVTVLPFLAGPSKFTNEIEIHSSKFDLHSYVDKNPLDSQQVGERKRLKQIHDFTLNDNCTSNNFKRKLEDLTNNSSHKGLNFGEDTNAALECTKIKLENLNFHEELRFEECMAANFCEISMQDKLVDQTVNVVPSPNNPPTKLRNTSSDYSLQSVLLSDNSLLNSLPTLRTSVEELMLTNVDSSQVTHLLDNSTSSDEVMNVDQFVNERFKNFTEPDIELPNSTLGLDLPSLDLFQFHSS